MTKKGGNQFLPFLLFTIRAFRFGIVYFKIAILQIFPAVFIVSVPLLEFSVL